METESPQQPFNSFREELCSLLNKHSRENESDTPDFILTRYVAECLAAFDTATRARDEWYGNKGLHDKLGV